MNILGKQIRRPLGRGRNRHLDGEGGLLSDSPAFQFCLPDERRAINSPFLYEAY